MSANVQYVPDTGYFSRYIQLVNDDNIMAYLDKQCKTTFEFFSSISEEKSLFRYAAGKWSIREIAGHICDAERIFAYRALRFARRDQTVLSPFDENDFVANADFDKRTMIDLAIELKLIRESNMALFRPMGVEVLERKGQSGIAMLSVREILYVMGGHQQHHLSVIKERYLDSD